MGKPPLVLGLALAVVCSAITACSGGSPATAPAPSPTKKWDVSLGQASAAQRDGYSAEQVPAIGDDGTIYAGGGLGLHAIRPDGTEKWRFDSPAQLTQGIEDNLRTLAVDHLAAVNLRLMDDARPGQRFDDQLTTMVKARDSGLIGGVGLSNVTLEHLVRALAITDIACVQNPMNLADRRSLPVLEECQARGIAFVPFFPLGSAFARGNPVLRSPQVASIAARLGRTPAQIALAWLLSFRPNILLIPGTSSVRHLEENMAVRDIELDAAAREALASAD